MVTFWTHADKSRPTLISAQFLWMVKYFVQFIASTDGIIKCFKNPIQNCEAKLVVELTTKIEI